MRIRGLARRTGAGVTAVLLLGLASACGGQAPADMATSSAPPTAPISISPSPTPKSLEERIAAARGAVVRVETARCEGRAVGTGFAIDDHRIVTAAHVIDGAVAVTVQGDGFVATAEVIGANRDRDVAVLWVDHSFETTLSLGQGRPGLGAEVTLLGFPDAETTLQASRGIVSGTDGEVRYDDGVELSGLIATDASINGGNSGGPALAADDTVMGLVTGKQVWLVGDVPAEGRGFLIPSDQLMSMTRQWTTRAHLLPAACDGSQTGSVIPFPVTVETADPVVIDLTRTLALFGQAISSGDYRSAWQFYSPAAQVNLGDLSSWQAGLQTSTWASLDVTSGGAGNDSAGVDARIRTYQDSAFGPQGQSCTDWHLGYSLSPAAGGGGWLIDKAVNLGDSPKPCDA